MPRKKSRKKSADAKILQKLNEIDREFKSMERFRLSMVKSRKTRIMKRIKKGEPADYKGYKKELTARVKTHLSRVNKSIKAYSKILKKKSRKPRKKTLKKKSVKKSRKPRKKKSVKKKSKRKKMKMCSCGIDVHFRMKKFRSKTYQDLVKYRQSRAQRSTFQKKKDRKVAMQKRKLNLKHNREFRKQQRQAAQDQQRRQQQAAQDQQRQAAQDQQQQQQQQQQPQQTQDALPSLTSAMDTLTFGYQNTTSDLAESLRLLNLEN
jgi:hypothetical protein